MYVDCRSILIVLYDMDMWLLPCPLLEPVTTIRDFSGPTLSLGNQYISKLTDHIDALDLGS